MSICITSRRRTAFTLIEIIVALTIMLVLAGVILPVVGNQLDMADATVAKNALVTIQLSISNPTAPANGTGGRLGMAEFLGPVRTGNPATPDVFPTRLSQLIILPNVAGDNRCKAATTAYTAAERTAWTTYGPFFTGNIVKSTGTPTARNGGYPTPVGTIRDTLVRISTSTVNMWLDSLTLQQAQNIDALVEGGTAYSPTTGTVTYAVLTGSYYRLTYSFPVTNAGCT